MKQIVIMFSIAALFFGACGRRTSSSYTVHGGGPRVVFHNPQSCQVENFWASCPGGGAVTIGGCAANCGPQGQASCFAGSVDLRNCRATESECFCN